jgi:hypothetical protein
MAPFSDFLPQKNCNPSAMDNVLRSTKGGWGGSILSCSQSANDPWKDLTKLGCKLNIKVKFKKNLLYFLLCN